MGTKRREDLMTMARGARTRARTRARARRERIRERIRARAKARAKARTRAKERARARERSNFCRFVSNVSPCLAMFFTCPVLMGNERWEFGVLSGAIQGVQKCFSKGSRSRWEILEMAFGLSLFAGVHSAAVARTVV